MILVRFGEKEFSRRRRLLERENGVIVILVSYTSNLAMESR